jgi:membrane-bound metal-dependent hydrolase YbcI (DUF457 family)
MDAITHAAVGYALGGVAGAVAAVAPDVVLITRRRYKAPPFTYRVTHSFWLTVALSLLSPPAALGHASHIALDTVTHRGAFSQMPLWPIGPTVDGVGEWEWFNGAWWTGLIFACAIVGAACLLG